MWGLHVQGVSCRARRRRCSDRLARCGCHDVKTGPGAQLPWLTGNAMPPAGHAPVACRVALPPASHRKRRGVDTAPALAAAPLASLLGVCHAPRCCLLTVAASPLRARREPRSDVMVCARSSGERAAEVRPRFYNRKAELESLAALLGEPPTAVLVLTGPPSCGKSGVRVSWFVTFARVVLTRCAMQRCSSNWWPAACSPRARPSSTAAPAVRAAPVGECAATSTQAISHQRLTLSWLAC